MTSRRSRTGWPTLQAAARRPARRPGGARRARARTGARSDGDLSGRPRARRRRLGRHGRPRRPGDRPSRAGRRPHRRGSVGAGRPRLLGRRRPRGGPPRLLGGGRRASNGPGNISDVLGCSITLGDLRITQGRLGDARRTYEDALQLAAAHEVDGPLRGTADMLVGLSQIACERNDLAATAAHLRARRRRSASASVCPSSPTGGGWPARGCARPGEIWPGAVDLLEEAERVYVGDFSPNVRPVPAQRARVLVPQGRIDEALEWARARELDPDDDLSYVREYEHVTLARILMHQRRRRREGDAHGIRAARPAEGRGRGGREDRDPDRDPGRAGARAPRRPRTARSAKGARPSGARAPAGGARGLRAGLRRRGGADGLRSSGPSSSGTRRGPTHVACSERWSTHRPDRGITVSSTR